MLSNISLFNVITREITVEPGIRWGGTIAAMMPMEKRDSSSEPCRCDTGFLDCRGLISGWFQEIKHTPGCVCPC